LIKLKDDLGLKIAQLINVGLIVLTFVVCWYGYYASHIRTPFYNKGNWLVIAMFAALYIIFSHIYDSFQVSINRISEMIYSLCLSVFLSDCIMFLVIWMLTLTFPNMLPGLLTLAVQFFVSIVWSFAAHKWYFSTFPPEKTAVVYDRRYGVASLVQEYGLDIKYDIRMRLRAEECLEDLRVFEGMDTVFICGVQSHERNQLLKYCVENGVKAYVIPRIGDIIMSGAKPTHMFHLPILQVKRRELTPEGAVIKRLFDIVSSGIVLVVLSPVMLVTAAAIKLYDGGPVLYKQRRLTKDGAEFEVFKFRSMRVDAEKDGVARLSTGDKDDRITPVGRIIRKVRIDELPQLINILGGDMSVVGPRPERPEIAAQYEEELPEFRLRLQVKAGLTGYAQVYGKYNTTPYDKLQMDLMYIANPSFLEDLRIIFATIKILFMPESTDGVAAGQTTAVRQDKK